MALGGVIEGGVVFGVGVSGNSSGRIRSDIEMSCIGRKRKKKTIMYQYQLLFMC